MTLEIEKLSRKKPEKKKEKAKVSAELKEMVTDMERVFQTPVELKGGDEKGKIIIEYRSLKELNSIYDIVQEMRNKK